MCMLNYQIAYSTCNLQPANIQGCLLYMSNPLLFCFNNLKLLLFYLQIVELIAGIGWGEPNSRKIIYWGMLAGDIMLVAVYAAFVHGMSEWHAVNITIVTLASAFGFLRIITLVLNPGWWNWGPMPQPQLPYQINQLMQYNISFISHSTVLVALQISSAFCNIGSHDYNDVQP